MRNTKAAHRYAKSLMDLSIEKGFLDKCFQDMKLVDRVLEENKELRVVLASPLIKYDRKKKILHELFEGKIEKLSLAFLDIVGEKGRDALLAGIVKAFIVLVKHNKNIMVAKVTSATPIDEETRKRIRDIILEVHQGELELEEEIDKNILGGFILNISDKRIDASVAGQIRDLRKEFENNPYQSQL